MPEQQIFKAFFSYAHHDEETDPGLVQAFTTALEKRVNAKLANARLAIWRDKEGLRTGHRLDAKIDAELRESDVLIVVLTPRWVESEYCRKEYMIFEEIERSRKIGEYVVPILVRTIKRQEKHFTQEQRDVYERVRSRKYQVAIATEFMKLSSADQTALIDKIADDIEGMIERRRELAATSEGLRSRRASGTRNPMEFDAKSHDFEEYDIIAAAEVFIDKRRGDEPRGIYAQVDFTERLFIVHDDVRIEFGVQYAYWSFRNEGPGKLSQADDLRSKTGRQNAYYLTRFHEPETVVLCIQALPGKMGLGGLALPPSINENRLAKIATATAAVESSQLSSQIEVIVKSEGLWMASEKGRKLSQTTSQWIEAIMTVAARRDPTIRNSGRLSRTIHVEER
jgi:hypothetical protein